MTFYAKETFPLLLVVAFIAILMGVGISFIINTTPATDTTGEISTVPPNFSIDKLRVLTTGTVINAQMTHSSFLIEDEMGVELSVTVATSTQVLETLIERDASGVEIRRIVTETSLNALKEGDIVKAYTLASSPEGPLHSIEFTTEIQSDLMEYLAQLERQSIVMRGTVLEIDTLGGVLILEQTISADPVHTGTVSLEIPAELPVYHLTNPEKPTIVHAQTLTSLDDVSEGDVAHILYSKNDDGDQFVMQALFILPTI